MVSNAWEIAQALVGYGGRKIHFGHAQRVVARVVGGR